MPTVSVLTPVYNGERYLAQCIESVLSQGFDDFEYIIVNNNSSDRTRQIAEQYADDPRIKLYHNDQLLPVIANYNRAASLVSRGSRYLKFLAADDLLLPDCLLRMVEVAAANPSVQVVSSYKIHGTTLVSDGLPFPDTVAAGHEICRRFFRGELGLLGGPTNHLIKIPVPLIAGKVFDEEFIGADTELFVRLLKRDGDYGFVHQVLTFTREHEETVSASGRARGIGASEDLALLMRHGPAFLSDEELRQMTRAYRRRYAQWLFRIRLKWWDRRLWAFQVAKQRELGISISLANLAEGATLEALDTLRSPAAALRSLKRERGRRARA
jgi:glycosyltransferase involved in cell wall biosynthesis